MLGRRSGPAAARRAPHFVAVEASGVGLVIKPGRWTRTRPSVQELFLDRVPENPMPVSGSARRTRWPARSRSAVALRDLRHGGDEAETDPNGDPSDERARQEQRFTWWGARGLNPELAG